MEGLGLAGWSVACIGFFLFVRLPLPVMSRCCGLIGEVSGINDNDWGK